MLSRLGSQGRGVGGLVWGRGVWEEGGGICKLFRGGKELWAPMIPLEWAGGTGIEENYKLIWRGGSSIILYLVSRHWKLVWVVGFRNRERPKAMVRFRVSV